jgi:hypothetical protein
VLGVFVTVSTIGLLYGVLLVVLTDTSFDRSVAAQASLAPSVEEYHVAAAGVVSPFLTQAGSMDASDLESVDPLMQELVARTQERLLRMLVPAESRDEHLAVVLLLSQWDRALGGSQPDQAAVLENTAEFIMENPWVIQ